MQAYLQGDKDGKGIEAASISLNAEDTSTIDSFTGAVSVAASGGLVGVSLSIGVGVAFNEIDNDVAGFIKDIDAGVTDRRPATSASRRLRTRASTPTARRPRRRSPWAAWASA